MLLQKLVRKYGSKRCEKRRMDVPHMYWASVVQMARWTMDYREANYSHNG